MAGGITDCPNWQQELADKLESLDIAIINPRRKNFPMGNWFEGMKQIEWEAKYLDSADTISFWFPKETLCPITLFELGSWSMATTPIFVGCHREYQRRLDIEIQLEIRCPTIKVVQSIDDLAEQILEYYRSSTPKAIKNG